MSKLNQLDYLVIHCTDTPAGKAYYADDIIRWHTTPVHLRGRGWSRPGYNDMIYLNGALVNLIPFNTDDFVDLWEVANGAEGINGRSRHIVYVGGKDPLKGTPLDTRTDAQKETMEIYVKYLLKRHPQIQILGHNQSPRAKGKACPCFDVPEWLRQIGIPKKNIFPVTLHP